MPPFVVPYAGSSLVTVGAATYVKVPTGTKLYPSPDTSTSMEPGFSTAEGGATQRTTRPVTTDDFEALWLRRVLGPSAWLVLVRTTSTTAAPLATTSCASRKVSTVPDVIGPVVAALSVSVSVSASVRVSVSVSVSVGVEVSTIL